jgi:hypothetical protein
MLTERFNETLTIYQTRTGVLEDWEHLLLLSIAYAELKFEFARVREPRYLAFLFDLQKSTRHAYLCRIDSFFQHDEGIK